MGVPIAPSDFLGLGRGPTEELRSFGEQLQDSGWKLGLFGGRTKLGKQHRRRVSVGRAVQYTSSKMMPISHVAEGGVCCTERCFSVHLYVLGCRLYEESSVTVCALSVLNREAFVLPQLPFLLSHSCSFVWIPLTSYCRRRAATSHLAGEL